MLKELAAFQRANVPTYWQWRNDHPDDPYQPEWTNRQWALATGLWIAGVMAAVTVLGLWITSIALVSTLTGSGLLAFAYAFVCVGWVAWRLIKFGVENETDHPLDSDDDGE